MRVKNLTPPRTVDTSDVNASNERITITAHGYTANTPLTYSAEGGTAIAGSQMDKSYLLKLFTMQTQ